MQFSPSASPSQRQKAVTRLIADLNADTRPILCGPWRSELGFEVSYWHPFLAYLKQHVKDFDKRAAVVTRGGIAPLYTSVASQGFDLYALRSVEDVRRENLFDCKVTNKGETVKQKSITGWDRAVLADAAKALHLGDAYHVVHPAWMYWALEPYWAGNGGLNYLSSLTQYDLLPKIALEGMPALPERYVAVKCYARPTFPYPHPDVAEWVRQTVATLSAQAPVVLLNAGSDHDDHVDVPMSGPNIHTLPTVSPDQNLLVQAAVIAKATCFVGTYGGVAQLALRMGIPSVSVWLQWGQTAAAHHNLSWWLSKVTGVPFLTGSIADCVLWSQIVHPVMAMPKQAAA